MKLPIQVEYIPSLDIRNWLEEIWEIQSEQLRIPLDAAKNIFSTIEEKYNEGNRAYHNLSHIYSMLKLSEEFYDFIEFPHLVDLSIWFHDIIYDATQQNNEAKSAQFVIELLQNHLPSDFLKQLHQMILSTHKHSPLIEHHDNKLFLDLDLAILATEDDVYDKYVKAIREEYKVFPDELYYAGRKNVMEIFLKREHIYFTDFFRANFEGKARENIARELAADFL